jgi:hypothetical protein
MVKGTKAENLIQILSKISLRPRKKVKEVTLDMELIVKKRFHVQH